MTSRTRRGLAVVLSLVLLGAGLTVQSAFPASARAPRSVPVPVPTATSGLCRASEAVPPQVNIPASAGIDYSLDGRRVAAGPVTVTPGTHTVRASSQTLRLSGQTTFRLVLRGAGQCGATTTGTSGRGSSGRSTSGYGVGAVVGRVTGRTVVAAPAMFTDTACVSGRGTAASYQIPFVDGLMYRVDGKDQKPGRHAARDGVAVTVVAMAGSGRRLSGITQWTHTFAKAASGCAARSGSTREASSSTTHSGALARGVVTVGTILLLSGAGALLVASRRRRRGAPGRP